MSTKMIIGFDAKRIVSNGTGLGSYGRTLVNDLARKDEDMALHLYAPAPGRDDLREQIVKRENIKFCYPEKKIPHLFLAHKGHRKRLKA